MHSLRQYLCRVLWHEIPLCDGHFMRKQAPGRNRFACRFVLRLVCHMHVDAR